MSAHTATRAPLADTAATNPVAPDAAQESARPSGFVDLSETDLDALLGRIEEARTHELALSGEDYALILSAVTTLASMQEQLSQDDLTLRKLKKLLGMVRSSEKLGDLFGQGAEGPGSSASGAAPSRRSSGKGAKSGPRNKRRRPPAPKPRVEHHPMSALCKGDSCPAHRSTTMRSSAFSN